MRSHAFGRSHHMLRTTATAAVCLTTALIALFSSAAHARPTRAMCSAHSPADFAARELARTAETTAETIATDYEGSYARVSLRNLHAYEPSVVVSKREALHTRSRAYLLVGKGTATSYVIDVVAVSDGNGYLIDRTSDGYIFRTARVCGRKIAEW